MVILLDYFSKYKITQRFGWDSCTQSVIDEFKGKKVYPIGGHPGIDYAMNYDPIFNPIINGIILNVDRQGNDADGKSFCVVDPDSLISVWFKHCSEIFVDDNQQVSGGKMLALSGASGSLCLGAHLHLGIRFLNKKWQPINLNNGTNGFVNPLDVKIFYWKDAA